MLPSERQGGRTNGKQHAREISTRAVVPPRVSQEKPHMRFTSWKLIGCLALAAMLTFPLDLQAKGARRGAAGAKAPKAGKADKAGKKKSDGKSLRLKDLPRAVRDAIKNADPAAKVGKIIKTKGKKKNAGQTLYVARLTKGGQQGRIGVSADGTVVKQLKWKDGKGGKGNKSGKHKKGKK